MVANDSSGTADGKTGPALTGQRHPLYRLKRSDVVEIHFTFAPEYDQSVIVQPDGFIALKDGSTLLVEGRTLPELEKAVARTYSFMRAPEISVSLKEFERPSSLQVATLDIRASTNCARQPRSRKP